MKIYNYIPFENIFSGESDANPDPLNSGQFLIPAFATTVKPPFFGPDEQAYWNGSAWEIQNIPQPTPEPEPQPEPITWDTIRAQRNGLLFESDWVGLSDSNPPNKQAWLDYRQALRDIPQNFTNPEDVIWPTKP